MYVYFRPRNVDAGSFETQLVESGAAQATVTLLGLSIQANEAGARVVKSQLERGFTVIRYGSEGETEFGSGTCPRTEAWQPFRVESSSKITLANDRTEVHTAQQDYWAVSSHRGRTGSLPHDVGWTVPRPSTCWSFQGLGQTPCWADSPALRVRPASGNPLCWRSRWSPASDKRFVPSAGNALPRARQQRRQPPHVSYAHAGRRSRRKSGLPVQLGIDRALSGLLPISRLHSIRGE